VGGSGCDDSVVAVRLRRLPGQYYGHHPYAISGSLDGVVPGRRSIAKLIVGRLGADATEGLRPLEAFTDLRELELEWPVEVDLRPLTNLPLERLRIENAKRLDLAPIAQIDTLKSLEIASPKHCALPAEWPLNDSLTRLMFAVDRDARGLLEQAVAAIPWSRLHALQWLALLGDNGTPVDLAFLAQLPQLQALDLRGIQHRGPRRSPLEPPFSGLPPELIGGLIEVPKPATIREQLMKHRGLTDAQQDSMPRFRDLLTYDDDADGDWSVYPPEGDDDDGWSTYGSLCLAAEGQDGDTEYEALAAAKRRLRAADPDLLRSLDFDQEADGTGISAPTREQVERALRILGLPTHDQ
jgi:hypothetical protein